MPSATAACQDITNSKNLLTSPDGLAFGLRRVHKKAQDFIRQLDYMFLRVSRSDDQRAIAFLATHNSPFANSFPVTSDPTLPFSQREVQIDLGREMGSLLP